MNKRVIKKIIKAKLTRWTNSIEDDYVRNLVKKNTIVTGGCIASMLLNEKVNDYDIYFHNKKTVLAVARYYANKFNELNPKRKTKIGTSAEAYVLDCDDKEQIQRETGECERLKKLNAGFGAGHLLNLEPGRVKIVIRSDGVASEDQSMLENGPFENPVDLLNEADDVSSKEIDDQKPSYRPVFLSSNAITLSDKVQLVIRFHGNPEEIHENYDFVHCTNYYDSKTDKIVLRQDALEALMAKELVYVGSKYPVCSVIRTRKFIKRGFHISAGQYLKMCYQISNLDLSDLDVLEDQLVGVDSHYFMALISALRAKSEKDSNFEMNQGYLSTVIDRVFG